jgi:hypothetical protein
MHVIPGKLMAGVVALVIVTAACSGDTGSAEGGGQGGSGDASYGAPQDVSGQSSDEATGTRSVDPATEGGAGSGEAAAENFGGLSAVDRPIGPSVIKTAALDIKVPHDEFQASIRDAVGIAGTYGGFVVASDTTSGRFRSGSVSIRVPGTRFEQALARMSALGDVRSQNVTGQDVSQEFVDLEARLRNWKTQEAVILGLMRRATTIEQTIRIQSELSQIQLEIEQIRGRLNFLEDQTAFGTITASFVTGAAPAPAKPNPFVRAWRQALDTMTAIATGIVLSMGVVLPLAILLLLIWLVIRQLRPRLSS